MRITIKKIFFAWQMEKEQAWLEEKAREGLILESIGIFKYHFIESKPQDLVYQFDFQFISKKNEDEYLALFEGWNMVDKLGSWYYFCKVREGEGKDVIFSDNDSKRQMFRRLLLFLALVGFPLLYQVLFIFPSLDLSETTFPKFYFFFRIVIYLTACLYTFAVLKIIIIYKKLYRSIKE